MKKVAIVYYSGTGNTQEMASTILDELSGKAEAALIECSSFSPDDIEKYDAFAFGCPAMGNEVLEEDSFEPMFTSIEDKLINKDVILFGSYGWGDGEWMRNWEERVIRDKANLKAETVIAMEAPDEDAKEKLKDAADKLIS